MNHPGKRAEHEEHEEDRRLGMAPGVWRILEAVSCQLCIIVMTNERLFRMWFETVTRYRGLVAEKYRPDDRRSRCRREGGLCLCLR
jgi:hypothetical protein